MKVFLVGATGFVGRTTTAFLLGQGHDVVAWVRDSDQAKDQLGRDVTLVSEDVDLVKEMENADVVVNLSGQQLSGVRWTKNRKKRFYESRVGINNQLVEAMKNATNLPHTFLSANAIGFYSPSSNKVTDEDPPNNDTFLGKLCSDWEQSANEAKNIGVRVCNLKFGLVLGREGGILAQMSLPFEYGVATNLGFGNHMFSWIHILDLVRAIGFCIDNSDVSGSVNITSPNPVKCKEFVKALAKNTVSFITVPVPTILFGFVYGFGESAKHLTNSHNVIPEKLVANGFSFVFEEVFDALNEEFNSSDVKITDHKLGKTDSSYPLRVECYKKASAQYELNTSIKLKSDTYSTFGFFSSPLNLGMSTPNWMGFRILEMPEHVDKGSTFAYKINLGPLPFRWRTEIAKWSEGEMFIDFQTKGPYSLWWHEHRIIENSNTTSLMEDRVLYRVPLGLLGRVAHFFFVKRTLFRIFSYRRRIIQLRFGG